MPLPEPNATKGRRHARALRRATLDYWYATLEDAEAAAIEAGNATFHVNILDEAVFAEAHGAAYIEFRRNDRLAQVAMGLELIRNCETHSSEVFGGLLVSDRIVSVPTGDAAAAIPRTIYSWPAFDDLPRDFIERTDLSEKQLRARPQSIDGYKREVAGRTVIETLLDAIRFFESLDPQLRPDTQDVPPWAFGLLSDEPSDEANAPRQYIARPLGFDVHELVLPDLSCHPDERRSARQDASDRTFEGLAKLGNKNAKKEPPAASSRQITHRLVDGDKTVGYAGMGGDANAPFRPGWAETAGTVWRDVQRGYPYWVTFDGDKQKVTFGDQREIRAHSESGHDLLTDLPHSDCSSDSPVARQFAMWQQFPDLYMRMRRELDLPAEAAD